MLLFFGVWKLKKCQVQRCGFEEWQSSTWRNVAIGSGKLFFLGNLCLIRSCILVILVVFQRGKRNKGSENINSQAYHLQLTQELFSTMSCQVESYWWRRSKSRNLSLPWYPFQTFAARSGRNNTGSLPSTSFHLDCGCVLERKELVLSPQPPKRFLMLFGSSLFDFLNPRDLNRTLLP